MAPATIPCVGWRACCFWAWTKGGSCRKWLGNLCFWRQSYKLQGQIRQEYNILHWDMILVINQWLNNSLAIQIPPTFKAQKSCPHLPQPRIWYNNFGKLPASFMFTRVLCYVKRLWHECYLAQFLGVINWLSFFLCMQFHTQKDALNHSHC